jgi:hypothetical protein
MPPQQKVRHTMKLIIMEAALKFVTIIHCTKQLGSLCTFSLAMWRISLSLCP